MSRSRDIADLGGVTTRLDQVGNSDGALSNRNMVTNGSMQHWQRGISNTSVNDGVYLADRFSMRTSNNGWYRADQSTDAPEGFPYSLKITSLGSNTPSSGAYIFFSQKIEGFNTVPLAYGTASAKTVTLSFYVRSSLAGTHGGAIRNNAQNRSYPFSYTINAIDTWEYKTITIVGDTTGTWVGATNGIGLELIWNLGSGSNNIGTAGAWQSAGKLGATGEVNIVSTNGATLYLTGLQLELGDTSTDFEHISYGDQLQKCQRYFEKYNGNLAGGTDAAGSQWMSIQYKVTKRVTPTITYGALYSTIYNNNIDGFSVNRNSAGEAYITSPKFDAEL
jgi:hypothetical protein